MKKWLTPNIKMLSWVSLFTDMASEMIYPIMPIFLLSIGYSATGIGFLEGFAEAIAGLSKGFFGALSDHTGKRTPFVRIGYGLSAFAKPLLAVFQNPISVFLLRTGDRLGKGIRTGARDALLADESTVENRAKVLGYHRSLDTIGAVVGPAIAIVILYFYPKDYFRLFVLAIIPGLIAIYCTFRLKITITSEKKTTPFRPFAFLNYFKYASKSYNKLVFILIFFSIINSSDMFLLMKLKSMGVNDIAAIAVYITYNAVFAIFAFPFGKLATKIGMKNMLVCGIALFSISYFGIGLSNNLAVALFFFSIYGLYAAATDGVSKAFITTLCNPSEKATALGLFAGMQSITSLLSGFITGIIWWKFGATAALITSAIAALLICILLVFVKIKPLNYRIL